jgi:octaprenyl-diphosphate synthase
MRLTELATHYEQQLFRVDEHMSAGFRRWPWEHRDHMRGLVENYLTRTGKKLRPLFAILCIDLLGGDLDKAPPIGAGLELYHSASLILDDVQDNTSFRQGGSTVHINENVSNAINFAGIIRSFSYYPVHDAVNLTTNEKLALHHQFDAMATLVPLGQSMEIGWHQGWYDDDVRRFPYLDMIRLKTGAPFACAAASAAVITSADVATFRELQELGFEVGSLYQLVDDFRDMFSAPQGTTPEDLASGKPSHPLWILIEKLAADESMIDLVLHEVRHAGRECDRSWILDLMRKLEVDATLEAAISDQAERLRLAFGRLSVTPAAYRRMQRFLELCRQLVHR